MTRRLFPTDEARDYSHLKRGSPKWLARNNKPNYVPGVTWSTSRNRWRADISIERQTIALGEYNDWFEAVCARKSAEIKLL